MLIVFNKSKIYSYIVSLCTVAALFVMAFFIIEDNSIISIEYSYDA